MATQEEEGQVQRVFEMANEEPPSKLARWAGWMDNLARARQLVRTAGLRSLIDGQPINPEIAAARDRGEFEALIRGGRP